jgi:hypothetical protein
MKVIPFYYFNKFGPELMIFKMKVSGLGNGDILVNLVVILAEAEG